MSHNGKDTEKLVAIVSPWEKLPALARRNFRIESLPDGEEGPGLARRLAEPGVAHRRAERGRRHRRSKCRSNRITNWKAVE